MPFIDTLRHALEQLRATAKASIPSHKVGEEEMTVDPALKGVEREVREELGGPVGMKSCVGSVACPSVREREVDRFTGVSLCAEVLMSMEVYSNFSAHHFSQSVSLRSSLSPCFSLSLSLPTTAPDRLGRVKGF